MQLPLAQQPHFQEYIPETRNTHQKEHMRPCVHCSTVYNSEDLGTAKGPSADEQRSGEVADAVHAPGARSGPGAGAGPPRVDASPQRGPETELESLGRGAGSHICSL